MPQVCVVYDIYHTISIHCDVIYNMYDYYMYDMTYCMYDMTYCKAPAPL